MVGWTIHCRSGVLEIAVTVGTNAPGDSPCALLLLLLLLSIGFCGRVSPAIEDGESVSVFSLLGNISNTFQSPALMIQTPRFLMLESLSPG